MNVSAKNNEEVLGDQSEIITSASMRGMTLAQNDVSAWPLSPVFYSASGKSVALSSSDKSSIIWTSSYPTIVSVSNGSLHSYSREASGVRIMACLSSASTNYKNVCATAYVRVTCRPWTVINIDPADYPKNVAATKGAAQSSGNCYYADARGKQLYGRCCGSISYACYGNGKTLDSSTLVEWRTGTNSTYKYKLDGVSKDDCRPLATVTTCNGSSYAQKKESKNLNACEGTLEFGRGVDNGSNYYQFGDTCSTVSQTNFYSIVCEEKLTVDFVPSITNSIRLNSGTNYDLRVKSTINCKGEFSGANLFKTSYSNVLSNLNRTNLSAEQKATLQNQKKQLENELKTYNSWNGLNYSKIDSLVVNITNTKSGVISTLIGSDTIKDNSPKTYNNTHSLGFSNLTNPSDFQYVYTVERTFSLDKAYYNNKARTVEYSACTGCAPLENQFYAITNKTVFNNDFSYKINVLGLGYEGSWDAHATCTLGTTSESPIYRSIDVSNPFISSDRKIGDNWLDSTFDFTKIIKVENSTSKVLYEFDLSKEDIMNIKKDNEDLGIGSRLGTTCEFSNNKYVCNFIRNGNFFTKIYINEEVA